MSGGVHAGAWSPGSAGRYLLGGVSWNRTFVTSLMTSKLRLSSTVTAWVRRRHAPCSRFRAPVPKRTDVIRQCAGRGRGGQAGGDPEPGGWNRFQLTVDDLPAAVDELERAGARFRGRVVEGNGGRQILVEDPAGNPVELFEPARSGSVRPVPLDAQPLTPFLSIADVAAFIDFVTKAFNGTVVYMMKSADGVVRHCRLDVAGSQLMVSSGTDLFKPKPCMLHLYVEDVDAAYRLALQAGAVSLREPTDEFYGDRSAGVEDRWKNQWWIATHIEDVDPSEMKDRELEFRRQQAGGELPSA
jgi:PhnB protein